MQFYSTNHRSPQVSFREAVIRGMPPDNGLYMPISIPEAGENLMSRLPEMKFQDIALEISRLWLKDEVEDDQLSKMVYDAIDFDAPLFNVEKNIYSLELYHGPTYAFKDFGGRFMARLLSYFQKDENKETVILAATSGDTGSAVAHGFLNVPGVYVVLLYPSGKISGLQEKQITTLGGNVTALEVEGTFDDCQMLVKQAFLDETLTDIMQLTSANSINIGRLMPQTFYYFYAFAQLARIGKSIIFSVPSGNFGNLCGGLLAKRMGLPVKKFVAATNANNIFPEYLETGNFDPKPSRKTISNAMDVGNPSNFARVLELYGNNVESIRRDIISNAYSDFITRKTITRVYRESDYLLCPHSAIGYLGIHDALISLDDEDILGVFLSTAHPAKFRDVIDEFLDADIAMPHGLKNVLNKEKRSIPLSSDYSAFKDFLLKAEWRKS